MKIINLKDSKLSKEKELGWALALVTFVRTNVDKVYNMLMLLKTTNLIKLFVSLLLVIVLIVGFYLYTKNQSQTGQEIVLDTSEVSTLEVSDDPFNATYLIEEVSYALKDGSIEVSVVPGSASLTRIKLFGEPAYGDVDSDGDDDAVVLLTVDTGGSGTFFYGALAINNNGDYIGTDTILLGDRIAPQSYRIVDGKGEINYVVRAYGESMDTRPSIGKTLLIKHDQETNRLIEIAVNFEGEANPDMMTLTMNPWVWVVVDYTEGISVSPNKVGDFVLTFTDEGTVSAITDCNSMSGSYTEHDGQIIFESLAMTKMFCENSQEDVFADILNNTESFEFTSKGELKLLFNGGVATFK